jgi:predicted negative regulator of RcsB-dependent stress response
MEPQIVLRTVYVLIILALIAWFAWEGRKMYKVHMYYKRRSEAYARMTAEIEKIEQEADEEARKNGNV